MASLIKTTQEIKSILSESNRPIGFVPTMGALHAGHVSLIKTAREECKTVVVSIFVNPLQFGPSEDLKRYPRDLEGDLKICKDNNVDLVFAPDEKEIYPTDVSKTEIIEPPKKLTIILCAKTRPIFFQGIATVVNKLFNIIKPDISYWGEKDLQQLHVIGWLVKEFKLPIVVKACPIIRESNSLACSSRNRYLTDGQKVVAVNIYKSLQLAKQNMRSGFFTVHKAVLESIVFLAQFSEIKVEYFEARDKENLAIVDENKTHGFYFFIAARVDGVRLIDNIEIA